MHIGILKSIALNKLGDSTALDVLETTIAEASKEGYVRAFLDAGADAQKLLQGLKEEEKQVAYCSVLLEQFPTIVEEQVVESESMVDTKIETAAQPAPKPTPTLNLEELDEDLNERELKVLRLMSARLSNKEIARELDLSTNTIKWYAKSIFEKLNVHGRVKAGEKARALGLV